MGRQAGSMAKPSRSAPPSRKPWPRSGRLGEHRRQRSPGMQANRFPAARDQQAQVALGVLGDARSGSRPSRRRWRRSGRRRCAGPGGGCGRRGCRRGRAGARRRGRRGRSVRCSARRRRSAASGNPPATSSAGRAGGAAGWSAGCRAGCGSTASRRSASWKPPKWVTRVVVVAVRHQQPAAVEQWCGSARRRTLHARQRQAAEAADRPIVVAGHVDQLGAGAARAHAGASTTRYCGAPQTARRCAIHHRSTMSPTRYRRCAAQAGEEIRQLLGVAVLRTQVHVGDEHRAQHRVVGARRRSCRARPAPAATGAASSR